MRKKILSATLVVAIAAIAGYNMYQSQMKCSLSELALANVEALANGEGTPTQPSTDNCIYDEEQSCIALHPTDASKDIEVKNAVWP